MDEKQITIEHIKSVTAPILKRHGVLRSALFGSVVRGESNDDSDVDFLVELPSGSTLFDLVGLGQDLEEALGKKADVVTFGALHPLLKEKVLEEAVSL